MAIYAVDLEELDRLVTFIKIKILQVKYIASTRESKCEIPGA